MKREVTTVDKDAYWYRMVRLEASRNMFYSWGSAAMDHIYRADVEYLGGESYRLSRRTYNGMAYLPDEVFTRRCRRKVQGYRVTIALIARLLSTIC